jgi:hypothetical protein
MTDPLVLWTAIGVLVVVAGQLGQFMHISSKMERRFTMLEMEMQYIQKALNSMEKR